MKLRMNEIWAIETVAGYSVLKYRRSGLVQTKKFKSYADALKFAKSIETKQID